METIFKLGIMMSIVDMVSSPANRIGQAVDGLRGRVASLGPVFDQFKSHGLAMTTVAAIVLHFFAGAVMATGATQAALGEMASLGVRDLARLEKAAGDFSNTWSGATTAQFVGAAYDIKSGISSLSDAGVAEFTKLAALTGKATKSTTAEMTSLFATGYGIYKEAYAGLDDMRFGQLFSAGISASVQQFKTTGSGMAQAISTMGATATTSKIAMQEQLAVLGMLQATMTGSEAGTKYKAVIQSAATAGKQLGLNFLDANKELVSLPEILTVLRGQFGETLDAAEKVQIQKAFGREEAMAVIDLLYNKVGDLTANINSLSAAMGQGTSFTEQMAAAMNQDIGAGVQLLGQRWHNTVEVIGKQLIPVAAPLLAFIGNMLTGVQGLAERFPIVTRFMVIGATVLTGLVFLLGGLAATVAVIGLMLPNFWVGLSQVGAGFAIVRAKILGALPAARFWLLWQKETVLWFLYQQGGVLAYAKTLALAPVEAARMAMTATWGYVTALYAQLAAQVAAAGGLRAYAAGLLATLIPALSAGAAAVWSFTAALLVNPVTWLWVGVVAVAGALYMLVRWVADLDVSWGRLWQRLLEHLGPVRRAVGALIESVVLIIGPLGQLWARLSGLAAAAAGSDVFQAGLYALGYTLGFVLKWGVRLAAWLLAIPVYIAALVGRILAIPGQLGNMAGWFAAMISGWTATFRQAGSALWESFAAGIKAKAMLPVEFVRTGLEKIRALLPFSDAKEGPLSSLTLSGQRIMETLGIGARIAAPALHGAVAAGLAGLISLPNGGDIARPGARAVNGPGRGETGRMVNRSTTINFSGDLVFPNIERGSDARDFINQLKHIVAEVDGGQAV